ncbi:SDR family NAD(P)-dependent oxidoreductase [Micromonospora sp. NPDC047187]|uniref:SDR family oxidoreductase n=1 Tax=Micromonospora sp. NPDC047187 TaxID=3155262 RepID=UPI0033F4D8CA
MTTTNETKTWIITGASSGLGLGLAEAALEAGEHVIGTARRAERFDGLKARYGDGLLAVEHDVRDTAGAAGVVQRALEVFGRVDVLVNNAGAPPVTRAAPRRRCRPAEAAQTGQRPPHGQLNRGERVITPNRNPSPSTAASRPKTTRTPNHLEAGNSLGQPCSSSLTAAELSPSTSTSARVAPSHGSAGPKPISCSRRYAIHGGFSAVVAENRRRRCRQLPRLGAPPWPP